MERTVKCACGGTITARANDDPAILQAVEDHRMSTLHQRWAAWAYPRPKDPGAEKE